MNLLCPFCNRETPRQFGQSQMCAHCGRRWHVPRGGNYQRERAEARRQTLTLSSPCPACGRRCLDRLGATWKCWTCKVKFTEGSLPSDRFARERAALATAKNVATVEEFQAHVAERMGLERVMIAE